jgi:hypothetical protein
MCKPHCWQYAKPTGVAVLQRGHVIVLPWATGAGAAALGTLAYGETTDGGTVGGGGAIPGAGPNAPGPANAPGPPKDPGVAPGIGPGPGGRAGALGAPIGPEGGIEAII